MAEYAEREKAYGTTMAGQLKAFLETIVLADDHLKDIAMHRVETILASDNITIEAVMSLLGIDPGLRFSINLPRIIAMKLGPMLITEAEIEGHMDVHAATEDTSHSKEEFGMDGEGKGGWGPISVKVKIHAQASIEQSHKRSSDYSAGIKWRVKVEQAEPPEMLMKVVDALVRATDMITDMNMAIVSVQAEKLQQKAFSSDDSSSDDSFSDDSSSDDSDDSFSDDSDDSSSDEF